MLESARYREHVLLLRLAGISVALVISSGFLIEKPVFKIVLLTQEAEKVVKHVWIIQHMLECPSHHAGCEMSLRTCHQ